jgi:excisionase family DNA binding protein
VAVGENRTDAHSAGRGRDRLTITEAAALLGVHKNTIRNRIKNGTYRAEQVVTERGPTYVIERESLLNSLTTNTLSSASQELVTPQAMEFVQELLRPFVNEVGEVREQLGAERLRREMAERERDELRRELDELRGLQESADTTAHEIHDRLAEQRSREQPPPDEPEATETAIGEQQGRGPVPEGASPQEPAQPRSWWQRWFGG